MNVNSLNLKDKSVSEIREYVSKLLLSDEDFNSLYSELFILIRSEQTSLKSMVNGLAGSELNVVADRIHRLKAAMDGLNQIKNSVP